MNNIWRNIDSKIRLFADDCVIYRKVLSIKDIEILQTDLDRLGERAEENEIKINPNKCKALSFTRARGKDRCIIPLGTKEFLKPAFADI